jgi:Flp pilus assembly protein TadG
MNHLRGNIVSNQSGFVTILLAILIPLVFIVLAFSLDLTGAKSELSNLNGATDSAAQSTAEFINRSGIGGKQLTDDEIKSYAFNILQNNARSDQSAAVLINEEFRVIKTTNNVTVKACSKLQPTLKLGTDNKIC